MSAADLRESVARAVVAMRYDEGEEIWSPGFSGDSTNEVAIKIASAALRAIADAGPTDAMVEAAAIAWYRSHGMPFDVLGDNTKATARKAIRAALGAALKEMGAG